jgi:hypothetical protein
MDCKQLSNQVLQQGVALRQSMLHTHFLPVIKQYQISSLLASSQKQPLQLLVKAF